MFRLVAFLAISAVLVLPISGKPILAKRTYFTVPFTIYCKGTFSFKATLWEVDEIENDHIGTVANSNAVDAVTDYIIGTQYGDGWFDNGKYEVLLRINHNCPARQMGPIFVVDKMLTDPECKTSDDRCEYPMQTFYL